MTDSGIKCANCGNSLTEDVHDTPRSPCSNCGKTARITELALNENLCLYDSLHLKYRRPNLPSDKKMRWDSFSGYEYCHKLKKMVKKEKTIDKDRKEYIERVTDIESGEIIHECIEPLPDHTGHGYAKKKQP